MTTPTQLTAKTLETFVKEWNSNTLILSGVPNYTYDAEVDDSFQRQFFHHGDNVFKPGLRISELGKYALPQVLRGVLYHQYGFEVMSSPTCGKSADIFHCGDVIESRLMNLWKAYGLDVGNSQLEVTWNGVLGHLDATVDGVVVDCKSANDGNFKRYLKKPPDSYLTQIACYADAIGAAKACLVFYNKNTSELGIYYLTDADRVRVLQRATELVNYANVCETIEDVYDYFEPPDLITEMYRKEATGSFVAPYDLYDPWPDLLYAREEGVSGYGDARKYVTRIRTPQEINDMIVDKGYPF